MATKKKEPEQSVEEAVTSKETVPTTAMADNRKATEILRKARKEIDVDALFGEVQRLKSQLRQAKAQGGK